MNFKKNIIMIVMLCTTHLLCAQFIIKGRVLDNTQTPIPGANITIEDNGKEKGNTSDASGFFSIPLEKGGIYEVQVSYIGFETYTTKINLKEKKTQDLGNIILNEMVEHLQSVEVIGRHRKDYNSDYSFSATKIAIKNRELPQAVSSVTKELIYDKQAYQLTDAVKGVSSVTPVSFYNHFSIRGITQNEDGQIINGMRTHQFYFFQPLTQNLERVEVIKGPSSLTFSSADPGGSINMVTKKPLKEKRHELTFAMGSFSTIRGGLDFTGPLNKDKTMLYRLNIAKQEAKSFRNLVQNDALLISPSFSYIPNENTSVNFELIYSDNTGNLDRGQPILGNDKTNLKSTSIKTNIAGANDYFQSKEFIAIASLSQRFTKNLQFNAKYMKQTWKEDLAEHRSNGFVQDINGNTLSNLVKLRYAERKQFWDTDVINAYLNYDFNIGKHKSSFLLGYDFNHLDKAKGNGQNGAKGYLKDVNGNIVTTTYNGIKIKKPKAGFYDLDNPSNTIKNTQAYEMSEFAIPAQTITTHGAYIQNVTKINDLTVLLSLRKEWFIDKLNYDSPKEVSYKNNVLLPRIGISYKLSNCFNVYGTYLKGFQPHMNTVSLMPVIASNFFWSSDSPSQYDPLESDLIEVGTKADLFNGRIKTSLSIFQINQKNILMQEKDANSPTGYSYTQRGKDRSRGIEWDLSGYINPNLQVSASYSYVDAIIKDDVNKDLIGKRKEATPEHSASLWAKYSFGTKTKLAGISFGAGIQYSGDKLGWYDRTLELPSYTVLDAVVYYKPFNSNFEFNFKVNNLLNEEYWTGAISNQRLFPGASRNFMFSTRYRF